MTLPTTPTTSELPAPPPPPLPPPPPPEPVSFPITWLLSNASGPIQYRAITEVARQPNLPPHLPNLVFTYRPALTLAVGQSMDGTWNRSMLTIPAEESADFAKVGTISAVRRLLEYGWDKDTPPLLNARRVLFRLLAEDDDQSFLFELGGASRLDSDMARRGRGILREAAAATLAQAGYESDPRLRGAARRILDRLDNYLRSPLAQKPWVRVGNRQVLAAEAAPPTIYGLQMLAFMPLFRHENHTQIDRLYAHLSQTLPRQEAVQAVGRHLVEQPQVVLGDPLGSRNVVDADVPFALHWLELMARFGFLRRNESWSRLFDRFLDDRDREHVWHPHKGTLAPRSMSNAIWHTFPLDAPAPGSNRRPDVTFRLGLIARLSGRPIELV